MLVRAQIITEAYFKYRTVAHPDAVSFAEEETSLLEAFMQFQRHLQPNWTKYSRVSWGLFLKTLRHCIEQVEPQVAQPYLAELENQYAAEFNDLIE